MPVTVTNLSHLQSLLLLGNIWHRPLSLRITIHPPHPPDTCSATLSFHAVKRAQMASFPAVSPPSAPSDSTLTSQIARALHHMLAERDQRRLFGSYYSGSLLEKTSAFVNDFSTGKDIHLFLNDLSIADEVYCEADHALAEALNHIRDLARRFSPFSHAEQKAEMHQVKVYGGVAKVDVSRYGLSRVIFEDDDDVDGALAQQAADLVHSVAIARTGAGVDGKVGEKAGTELRGVYAWEFPVSEVAKGVEESVGVGRYAKTAGVAMKVAAERTKKCLGELGVDRGHWLRFVAEHCGKEQAVYFAAVEGVGGVQRGVRDCSYSMFSGVKGEGVSVAATVGGLRDVGRMGFVDNVVEGGVSGGERRIVVEKEGGLLTLSEGEGQVVEGRIADDALVR